MNVGKTLNFSKCHSEQYPMERSRKSGAKPRNMDSSRGSIPRGDFKGSSIENPARNQLMA